MKYIEAKRCVCIYIKYACD